MPEDKSPNESTFEWPETKSEVETPVVETPEITNVTETPVTPAVEATSPVNADSDAVTPAELATALATEPILAPVTAVAPVKSPKKKLIILGAIIVGGLGLLLGGTAAAYNLWYQNPEKVVLEAVSSLFTTETSTHKISADIKSDDVSIKLSIDAAVAQSPASKADIVATITAGGKDYDVKAAVLSDKDGNLYLKVNDVKKLLTDVAGAEADFSVFDEVISKIDGQWVKISSEDLKSVSEEYSKTQECTTNALKSMDEKATQDEILAVYKKNDFIVIGDKIGVKDIGGVASIGYTVTVDETKANAFTKAFGETKIGKALTACDESFDFSEINNTTSDDSDTETTVEIWSSRFGHQLKELGVTTKDDEATAKIVWNPTFVKGVTVTAPEKSVPLKEIITDISEAYGDLYSSTYSYEYDSAAEYPADSMISQDFFKLTSLL